MEIDDLGLRRLSLGLALAGLLWLAAVSLVWAGESRNINEVGKDDVEQRVSVKGRVAWHALKSGTLLFGVEDGNVLDVVLFNAPAEAVELVERRPFVEVRGVVKRYRGKLEIVAADVTELAG